MWGWRGAGGGGGPPTMRHQPLPATRPPHLVPRREGGQLLDLGGLVVAAPAAQQHLAAHPLLRLRRRAGAGRAAHHVVQVLQVLGGDGLVVVAILGEGVCMGGVSGGAPSGATPGKGGRPQASPFFAGNGRSFATWSPERAACSSGNPVAPCGSRELDSNLRAGRLGLCTEFPCTAATLLPCNPHLLTQVSGGLAELGRSYTAWPTQPCDPASAGSLPTPGLTQGTEQAGARKTWVCTPTLHCRGMTPPPCSPGPRRPPGWRGTRTSWKPLYCSQCGQSQQLRFP